jgi:hypothetical protein
VTHLAIWQLLEIIDREQLLDDSQKKNVIRSIGTNVLSPWIANRNDSMSFCGRSFSINVPQNIGESPGAWLFTPSRHSWVFNSQDWSCATQILT